MAIPNTYTKHSLVRVSAEFTLASTDTDPVTVTCYYKDPTGNKTTLVYGTDAALVKDSTGKYHVDITAATSGYWAYRFEGSGTVTAANEAEFLVLASQLV